MKITLKESYKERCEKENGMKWSTTGDGVWSTVIVNFGEILEVTDNNNVYVYTKDNVKYNMMKSYFDVVQEPMPTLHGLSPGQLLHHYNKERELKFNGTEWYIHNVATGHKVLNFDFDESDCVIRDDKLIVNYPHTTEGYTILNSKETTNMKKYYKVCSQSHDNITSAVGNANYKIGEFTYGENGDFLFIFDTLQHAEDFIKSKIACKADKAVFECECIGVADKDNVNGFYTKYVSDLPDGTMFAYGVKLLKNLTEDNTYYAPGSEFLAGGSLYVLIQVGPSVYTLVSLKTWNRLFDPIKGNMDGLTLKQIKEQVNSFTVEAYSKKGK